MESISHRRLPAAPWPVREAGPASATSDAPAARLRFASTRGALLLLLTSLAAASGLAASRSQTGPGRNAPPLFDGYRSEGYPAISTPSKTITMAFVHSGTVDRVPVVESQTVAPGDMIAQLDDRVQRMTVQAQRLSAEDTSAVEAARKRADLAHLDLENVKELAAQDAAAPRELSRAEAEAALRDIEVRAASREHEQARLIHDREAVSLGQMTLRSPIHGIVARLTVEAGETIEALQPVAHIVSIDPLWMDVAVPVRLGMLVEPGSVAVIRWRDVPGGVPTEGRAIWVSAVADASSSTLIVRLEVDNPERLPAGLHALVQFPEADEALRRTAP